ncbi:MAG: holliday junction resolvase [Faunusvirus sp.]|jgi:hypothetical protein|uniref:Holliday junction resolvase n=1 Tax=Faunusvirus sp. TaxID=2487766 RepID=A0A3G5A288_9VIRU|nr:MAG: holliday junction resolvase [Faunusvirus sp.]
MNIINICKNILHTDIYNMKIVSWDVGIIHLAYCIMEYDKNNQNQPFKISGWNVIDLLDSQNVLICCGMKKSAVKGRGKKAVTTPDAPVKCTNTALYSATINNKTYGYCKVHFDQHAEVGKQQYMTEFIALKGSTHVSTNCARENCKTRPQWISLSSAGADITQSPSVLLATPFQMCTQHMKSHKLHETKQCELKFVKRKTCMNVPLDELKISLMRALDKQPEFMNVNRVIIENQPSLKNPRMKGMADSLYDYFLIRGIIDKTNNSQIEQVQFICPSNKLKVNQDNTIEKLSATRDSTEKYKMTKQLGIQYCCQLLKNDPDNLKFLNSHGKKDDLADSFLQGARYLSIQ